MVRNSFVFFLFSFFIFFLACSKNDVAIDGDGGSTNNDNSTSGNEDYIVNWNSAADSSSFSLFSSYWNKVNNYFNSNNSGTTNFQYWPQAHALDVMIDAYKRTNQSQYKTAIEQWYDGVKKKNGNTFLNVFYDDMEWNALAMLRAYNATQDERFKTAAQEVWTDIQTGWNDNAGGGISWKKDQPYSKNACSNGPACILAARMFRQFGDSSDIVWALKIYDWEKEYLFNQENGAVYDNLDGQTGTVKTNWIFTYNEGTFLGSALELYKTTGKQGYLDDAVLAADYTVNNLINLADGILKKEGEDDGGLFKGVFIRYFTQLILEPGLDSEIRDRYIAFLVYNAETLWKEGTNKQLVLFGPYWKTKPGNASNLKVQISGATLIEAVALLKKEKMLDSQ